MLPLRSEVGPKCSTHKNSLPYLRAPTGAEERRIAPQVTGRRELTGPTSRSGPVKLHPAAASLATTAERVTASATGATAKLVETGTEDITTVTIK